MEPVRFTLGWTGGIDEGIKDREETSPPQIPSYLKDKIKELKLEPRVFTIQ